MRKRVFRSFETNFRSIVSVEDDFGVRLVWRTLVSCRGAVFWYCGDARFPDFGRLVEISVSGTNRTRQHNDTKIAIRSILMCSSFRPRSIDVFCRFSRLETLSNDVKTTIFFFLKFHFPDTNRRRDYNKYTLYQISYLQVHCIWLSS